MNKKNAEPKTATFDPKKLVEEIETTQLEGVVGGFDEGGGGEIGGGGGGEFEGFHRRMSAEL